MAYLETAWAARDFSQDNISIDDQDRWFIIFQETYLSFHRNFLLSMEYFFWRDKQEIRNLHMHGVFLFMVRCACMQNANDVWRILFVSKNLKHAWMLLNSYSLRFSFWIIRITIDKVELIIYDHLSNLSRYETGNTRFTNE